ncbi:hypothetical protein K438DRAFT_1938433 [Mycena galopus ATCC 62051]|nr:hypothetical protein K438DRAFT_1938433 [Mycena galopus ATCC 62051]
MIENKTCRRFAPAPRGAQRKHIQKVDLFRQFVDEAETIGEPLFGQQLIRVNNCNTIDPFMRRTSPAATGTPCITELGICAHIEVRVSKGAYQKRILLTSTSYQEGKKRSEIGDASEAHLELAGKLRTKGIFEALLRARQTESLVLKKEKELTGPRLAPETFKNYINS